MKRLAPVVILAAVFVSGTGQVFGQVDEAGIITTIRDAAARHGVSGDRLVALGRCESRLDPNARGRAGELGLFQLLPNGLLRDFYAQGFGDPWSAAEQAEYTASAIARGLSSHWTCWRR